jgi:hypothetical protein
MRGSASGMGCGSTTLKSNTNGMEGFRIHYNDVGSKLTLKYVNGQKMQIRPKGEETAKIVKKEEPKHKSPENVIEPIEDHKKPPINNNKETRKKPPVKKTTVVKKPPSEELEHSEEFPDKLHEIRDYIEKNCIPCTYRVNY